MGISFSSDTLIRHVPDEEHLVYYKLNHQDAFREVNFITSAAGICRK